MGVWHHYFSAPCDEAAATAINRIGEQLPPWPFDIKTVRSRLFEERSKSRGTYVETKLVDPGLALRDLEALLTGQKYEDVAECQPIENDCDPLILALTESISAALADANDERLAAVVGPWSQIEEDWPEPSHAPETPEERVRWLLPWLHELAALARRARERSERLYCWCG